MSARRRSRTLTAVAAAVLIAGAGAAIAASGRGGVAEAKPATARFHDLDRARAAGYTVEVADLSGATCIDEPGVGGMGVHMLDPSLLDSEIDAAAPELLVYEPKRNGELKLVALEYLVFAAAWPAADPPALFGQEFDFVGSPNRYGLPPFWALHAWIWKPNPAGLLTAWNPRVECG